MDDTQTPAESGDRVTRDIRQSVEKGGAALLATRFSGKIIHMITIFFLMRLMGPDQFGIIGFAVIFKEMVLLTSNWGTSKAVIQKGADQELIASGQVIEAVKAVLFFAVLFVLAPFAADFFSTPEVELVIKISAIMVLVTPLAFTPIVRLTSRLRFAAMARASLLAALVSSIISIFMAYRGFGYMSIVYGNVSSQLCSMLLMWVYCHKGARLSACSVGSIRKILGFGFNLTFSGVVMWIYLNMDDLLVGKICGKTVLGLYSKAYYIATLPSQTLGTVLLDVTFPAYSKLKSMPGTMAKVFRETYTFNATLVIPCIIGILIMARPIVEVLFGEAWIGIIPILQVTCIIGLLRGLYGHANSIINAIGRPDYFWKVATPQAIIVLIPGYFATIHFGVWGMLWTVVGGMTFGLVAYTYLTFIRILKIDLIEYLRSLVPQIISTILMCLVLIPLRTYADTMLTLFPVIGLGILTYFCALYGVGGKDTVRGMWQMVRRVLTQ